MGFDLGICPSSLLADPMAPTAADLRAALDAAAAAGFTHASFWAWHLEVLADGKGLDAARRLVEDAGLRISTLEAAIAWPAGDDGAVRAEADQFRAALEVTGAARLVAAAMDADLPDEGRARRNLGTLVDAAQRAGATVCFEYLPWSAIPDLAGAWRLIEPLGPAAGLTLDSWHWQRQPGGPNPSLLVRIPPERLTFVQLSDACVEASADLLAETMAGRQLPGEGVVDFGAFLEAITAAGATPVVAVEVFNPSLLATLGVGEAARRMYAATQLVAPDRGVPPPSADRA